MCIRDRPQAFDGLRESKRNVRKPNLTFATMDHNVPTINRHNIDDPISAQQIDTLVKNCEQFGIKLFDLNSPYQGIVHVIGPEQGLTKPGMTIVCGDSHTSTHGAFGSLAFGIELVKLNTSWRHNVYGRLNQKVLKSKLMVKDLKV